MVRVAIRIRSSTLIRFNMALARTIFANQYIHTVHGPLPHRAGKMHAAHHTQPFEEKAPETGS